MAYGETTTSPSGHRRDPPVAEASSAWAEAPGRRSRLVYRLLAWLFGVCILIQVFAAGMSIFVDPAYWGWHRAFGHTFDLLPLIMLALAFPARLSGRTRWMTGALFALLIVQYATVNIGAVAAALHPVNAMLLFSLSMTLANRAGREGAAGVPGLLPVT